MCIQSKGLDIGKPGEHTCWAAPSAARFRLLGFAEPLASGTEAGRKVTLKGGSGALVPLLLATSTSCSAAQEGGVSEVI